MFRAAYLAICLSILKVDIVKAHIVVANPNGRAGIERASIILAYHDSPLRHESVVAF